MLKGVLTKRLLLGLAAVGAVGGGALVLRPGVAQAGFGGGTTILTSVSMRRVGASVACAGECLVRATEDDDSRVCPLRPGVQASYVACLTTLGAACATSCKSTP